MRSKAWSPAGLLVLCSALVTACGSGAVELRPALDVYAPGEAVELQLHNGSDTEVGYNLCGSPLERQSGTGWERLPFEAWVPPNTFCAAPLHLLPPDETRTYAVQLATQLEAGTYRFVARYSEEQGEAQSTFLEVASTPFVVLPQLGAQLRVDKTAYVAGQSAAVELHNTGTLRLRTGNLCHTVLEQQTATGWERLDWDAWRPPNSACTLEGVLLVPGGVLGAELLLLPERLAAGTYRFSVRVRRDDLRGQYVSVLSEPFTLTRP